MLSTILAERYAKALLKASQEAGDLEDTAAQARALEQALNADQTLRRYLTRPSQTAFDKIKIFSQGLLQEGGGLTPSLLKFLRVVLENKREAFLAVMLRKFQEQVDEASNTVRVQLTSASVLAPETLSLIAKGLSEKMGQAVELSPLVDESLIGGLKLKAGDRIYDGSLSSQLFRLGEKLRQGPRKRPAPKAKIPVKKAAKSKAGTKAKAKLKPLKKKAAKKPLKKKKR